MSVTVTKKVFLQPRRVLALAAIAAAAMIPLAGLAQEAPQPHRMAPKVENSVHHDLSPALRDIPAIPHLRDKQRVHRKGLIPPRRTKASSKDPVVQQSGGLALAANSGVGFDGIGMPNYIVDYNTPDPNGAPGAALTLNGGTVINQYVQWVNDDFAVFDKATGTVIYGPAAGNTLWHDFGGPCEINNDGDPIVQYDNAAHRWVLTQFSVTAGSPFYQCVAVSTGPDATGSYHRYAFQYADFNDYSKLVVWPDAYYISFNMYRGDTPLGSQVCAYDRQAMLRGAAATQQCFQLSDAYMGLLPSDLDGGIAPPAGSPNFFLTIGEDVLQLWKFHVDWASPEDSSLNGPLTIPVAPFTEACGGGICIPQKGTRQTLDSLGDRLMYRVAYRSFPDGHEALVLNHSVDVGSSVGVRWYELRNPAGGTMAGGVPVVYQQGTYAPDAAFRWMGSMAMDSAGNIALGYSVSSGAIHPGIRYTGRAPGDPLGLLSVENSIVEGSGSQLRADRWGDYSSMRIDPSDDCTLWYTNQYLQENGTFNWSTRIASFRFTPCGAGGNPTLSLEVNGSHLPITVARRSTVAVQVDNGPGNPTDWIGLYRVGAADTAYLAKLYLNGQATPPGTGLTSATVSFGMPKKKGFYEFRLFTNNGATLAATSPTVHVALRVPS